MINILKCTKFLLGLWLFFSMLGHAGAAPPGGITATPLIHRVKIDEPNLRMIVTGENLSGASFKVGGITIPASSITDVSNTVQYILFGADLAQAIPGKGSYSIVVDDAKKLSLYAGSAIPDPTPPPPGGTTCPCTVGWQNSGIPKDNWTWCTPLVDGTQVSLSGMRDQFFIATAFDPNHVDSNHSFCALDDGSSLTVFEPIVNWDQYDDCETWMWVNICI